MNAASPITLAIRVDAGPDIGAGHAMRCLALAQAWRDAGAGPLFVITKQMPDAIRRRYEEEGAHVAFVEERVAAGGAKRDPASTIAKVREIGVQCVVVDGYDFDDAYEAALTGAARVSLVALDDDHHAKHTAARIVLNQNPSALEIPYAASTSARLLLGTRYTLIRREIRAARDRRARSRASATRPRSTRPRLLVTTGGADNEGVTLRALDAVRSLEAGVDVVVVLGGGTPNVDAIVERARGAGHEAVVDAPDMGALYENADLALSTAGSTSLELAACGVPAVVVVVADNQRALAAKLLAEGAVAAMIDVRAGHHVRGESGASLASLASAASVASVASVGAGSDALREPLHDALARLLAPDVQERVAAAARRLVDGEGAARVVAAIVEECAQHGAQERGA